MSWQQSPWSLRPRWVLLTHFRWPRWCIWRAIRHNLSLMRIKKLLRNSTSINETRLFWTFGTFWPTAFEGASADHRWQLNNYCPGLCCGRAALDAFDMLIARSIATCSSCELINYCFCLRLAEFSWTLRPHSLRQSRKPRTSVGDS